MRARGGTANRSIFEMGNPLKRLPMEDLVRRNREKRKMDRYRVMFLDGSVDVVHADDAAQAIERAVVKRKNAALSGSSLIATAALKDGVRI